MSGYYYRQSEPGLWTVGCDDAGSNWHSDSDHSDREKAANRVRFLNGGFVTVGDEDMKDYQDGDLNFKMKLSYESGLIRYEEEEDFQAPTIMKTNDIVTMFMLHMLNDEEDGVDDKVIESLKEAGKLKEETPNMPIVTLIQDGKAIRFSILSILAMKQFIDRYSDVVVEKFDNEIDFFSTKN